MQGQGPWSCDEATEVSVKGADVLDPEALEYLRRGILGTATRLPRS